MLCTKTQSGRIQWRWDCDTIKVVSATTHDQRTRLQQPNYKQLISTVCFSLSKSTLLLIKRFCILICQQKLTNAVLEHFGESIEHWIPKDGVHSFFFSSDVPKGEIIDIMSRKIRKVEEKEQTSTPEKVIDNIATALRTKNVNAFHNLF